MAGHRTNSEGDTFHEAMRLIDPSDTLVPGTVAYDMISDMILGWIEQCGTEYALCMAKVGSEHLERWRKFL